MPGPNLRRVPFLFILTACALAAASAQEKPSASPAQTLRELPRGQLLPKVPCAAKPAQSYALYLPSNYSPAQRWPVIYVSDPLARGLVAAERMKDAAERYGYILAASNNSANGPWQPRIEALQAIAEDTHARLSLDGRRVYFAGFSGGARVSAWFAQVCKCACGVFLSGAGFAEGSPPNSEVVFTVFSAVGLTDFNYPELVGLDAQLDALGYAHFLRRFDGGHDWAPPEVWEEALAWMTLMAMKDGGAPRSDGFIAAELARATERARKLEESGELYFAWQDYRAAAAAFAGLADTAALQARAAALEKNPARLAAAKREKSDIEQQGVLQDDIFGLTNGVNGLQDLPKAALEDARLRIVRLRGNALEERRPEARRVLERARSGVFAALVEAAAPLLDAGNYRAAEPYFELAAEAYPGVPWPRLALAQCRAAQGDNKGALRHLRAARKAGGTPGDLTDFVKKTPALAPLAASPEFEKLVAPTP